ncbi:hypothetical protein WJX72_006752 [[Myrmecia] bisecta]|uniref:protein-serine/threonine phosphatase n=1 Tax=[Myrmecia] bisecta TaxID=41462 RepID=A0AAW1QRA7_9CHLO
MAPPLVADPRRKRLSDTGNPAQAYAAKAAASVVLPKSKSKTDLTGSSRIPHILAESGTAVELATGHPDAAERCFSTLSSSGSGLGDRTALLQSTDASQVLGVTVTYGVSTQAGMDPGGFDKDNQDAWLVVENLGNTDNMFLGVFDGHGAEGRKISSALVRQLPHLVSGSPAYKAQKFQTALTEQFLECNNAIQRASTINCALSGSTAITALLQSGRKLLVANGRVGSYMYNGQTVGPLRVWLANQDIPGLSMTRAFGDTVAASVGIIAEPEFKEITLQPRDKYLVLCSDGIFEFMTNQQIMQTVHDKALAGCKPTDIGAYLIERAREQWIKEEEDVIDDCTIIVCMLDVTVKPKAHGPAPAGHSRQLQRSNTIAAPVRRLLTLPLRPHLPSFYILGFPKSGTTSLANHLKRHPAIGGLAGLPWHETLSKESHYFNGVFGAKHAYSAALYRSFFPTILSRWWAEVVLKVDEWKCFDACPMPACLPYTAARIAALTPNAKLIFMMREPVAGVFSAEMMFRNMGMPLSWSLVDAVAADDERFQETAEEAALWKQLDSLGPTEPLPDNMPEIFYTRLSSLLRCGQYADRIAPFLKVFPPENFMFIDFKEFINNTEQVLEQVFEFIGVDATRFQYEELPPGMKTDYKGRRMHPSVRQRLQEVFQDSNSRLYALLGRDFHWADVEKA